MTNYQIDKYLQDGQDPKVVEKIHSKIMDMLTPSESINYIALQKKPAVTLLPDSITLSNKRLFLCEFTKLGLATNFEIFPWQDIKDISFKEEIFGSKVTVIPFTGENLTVDYIPKIQARKLYQLIKAALDNLQQEKSHKKSEEKQGKIVIQNHPNFNNPNPGSNQTEEKAQSFQEKMERKPQGSVLDNTIKPETTHFSAPQPQNIKSSAEPQDEITLKLVKLKNLYDKQLITQAEYETKKADILSNL